MKRYIQHLQDTRTPHERRQFAMRVATVVTALLFVAWLATLGVRFGSNVPEVAGEPEDNNSAAVLQAVGNE